ncbi:MAG: M28 family metallopeptidase [Anaerolineae bacterium]
MIPLNARALDKKITGEIYASDTAFQHLLYLCDVCGHRFTGSAGEMRAATYVAEQMRQYGLANVRMEDVPLRAWKRGEAQLRVLAPRPMQIECLALPYSPVAAVEADLLDLGPAVPEMIDARREEIAGKVVLVSSANPPMYPRPVHRMEKYARLVKAGAVGFIFAGDEPGQLPQTGSLPEHAPIPAVGISQESGAMLSRLARDSVEPMRVNLAVDGTTIETTSHNVIGELPGQQDAPVVVLGAHLDSHDIAPGANDNASGVVAVLEAARALAEIGPLPLPVRFILFTGEELGLLGAYHHVRAHADALPSIRFVLNLDSVAGPGKLAAILQGWPELLPRFKAWGRQVLPECTVLDRLVPYSDHFPFTVEGIPAAMVATWGGGGGRGWGHTAADTVDKVSILSLQTAAAFAARMALRIAADEEPWPAHRSRQEMQTLFEREGLKEVMSIEGRWPF